MDRSFAESLEGKTIDQLIDLRLKLAEKVAEIQGQLASRKRDKGEVAAGEVVLTGKDYWDWRTSALGALRNTQAKLSRLNVEIKRVRVAKDAADHSTAPASEDPLEMLRATYMILHHIASEVDLEPEEQAAKDRVQSYLRAHGFSGTP